MKLWPVWLIWTLLSLALAALGGVKLLARRRGTDPDSILSARPGLTLGAFALWGTALIFASLAWAWSTAPPDQSPAAWVFLALMPACAVSGFLLGLRQAERENKSKREVRHDSQA